MDLLADNTVEQVGAGGAAAAVSKVQMLLTTVYFLCCYCTGELHATYYGRAMLSGESSAQYKQQLL